MPHATPSRAHGRARALAVRDPQVWRDVLLVSGAAFFFAGLVEGLAGWPALAGRVAGFVALGVASLALAPVAGRVARRAP